MNLSTLTHIHLLLNHFPTVGFGIGLGLFLVGLYVNSDPIKRASLGIFLIIALLSIPVYMTGKAAQRAIQEEPGVSSVLMETHQDAALTALVFMEITGLLAWLGLWQFRRVTHATKANLTAVLVLSHDSRSVHAESISSHQNDSHDDRGFEYPLLHNV